MPLPPRPAPPRRPLAPSQGDAPPGPDRSRALTVWSVLAAFSAVLPILALVGAAAIPPAIQGPPALLVLAVLAAAALADAVLAWIIPGVVRRGGVEAAAADADATVSTQFVIAAALGASSAAVASVAYFLTGEPAALGLLLLPAAVFLSWFPSEARWLARRPAPGPGTPRAPLVR